MAEVAKVAEVAEVAAAAGGGEGGEGLSISLCLRWPMSAISLAVTASLSPPSVGKQHASSVL